VGLIGLKYKFLFDACLIICNNDITQGYSLLVWPTTDNLHWYSVIHQLKIGYFMAFTRVVIFIQVSSSEDYDSFHKPCDLRNIEYETKLRLEGTMDEEPQKSQPRSLYLGAILEVRRRDTAYIDDFLVSKTR
jgi:hypothetical protein